MKTPARSGDWRLRLSRRVALAACPERDRRWVRALFAELDVIDGPQPRFSWMLGAARLVAARNKDLAVTLLSGRAGVLVLLGLFVAFLLTLSVRAGFEGFEGAGVDDDVFLHGARVIAAVSLALLAWGLLRAFRRPGAAKSGPRRRA